MGERNHGLDLLRVVSMFYVVLLHTLGAGGILESPTLAQSGASAAVWGMEIWCYCAVDIFALLSGYFGYRAESRGIKLASYLDLWLQVVFYGVAATATVWLLGLEPLSSARLLPALLPVTYNRHWYFTAYTGVVLAAPLLNTAVAHTDDKRLKRYALVFFLVFSLYASVSLRKGDTFYLASGYSFLWLALLYLLGAVVRKTGLEKKVPAPAALAAILGLTLVTLLWQRVRQGTDLPGPLSWLPGQLLNYISPVVLAAAFFHLSLFARLTLPSWLVGFTRWAAPGSFAIYLLNTQPTFWDYCLYGRFTDLPTLGAPRLILFALGYSLAFVLAALAIDFLRRLLFRALGVKKFTAWVETTLRRRLSFLY